MGIRPRHDSQTQTIEEEEEDVDIVNKAEEERRTQIERETMKKCVPFIVFHESSTDLQPNDVKLFLAAGGFIRIREFLRLGRYHLFQLAWLLFNFLWRAGDLVTHMSERVSRCQP